MPDYTIRDPKTGRTITLRGEGAPPTEAEIEAAFAGAPSDTPAPRAKDEGAASLLPTAGGVVGGVVGGPLGAAAGGAAGQGFRELANHAAELPGAVADIVRSGKPMAAAKGFAEGSGIGAVDAAVQGGLQGALAGVGSLVMKAPSALLGAAEFMGVPGASAVGRGFRLLKGGKALLGTAAPVATEAAPQTGGRLVGARVARPIEQEMADALGEVRAATAKPRITTPPEPNLPAGYTPRATVPKPRPSPTPAAEPTAPKRAYFLKSLDEMGPLTEAPVKPLGRPVGVDDLPQAWRSRVGQSLAKPDAALASDAATELTKRGLSPEAALEAIAKDPTLSPSARLQLRQAILQAVR